MIMLKLQMITVEVIQMVVKANHDISSGLDTAFINSAINSNLAYRLGGVDIRKNILGEESQDEKNMWMENRTMQMLLKIISVE